MAQQGINKVILIGRLGDDPDVKYMPSGDAVANISVATSESWKDKESGEKKESTEWHRVVFFGKLAEIVGQYLKKGSKVYVEGRLKTRKWQNKEGNDVYTTEVVVDSFTGTMQMLDSKGSGDGTERATAQAAAYQHSGGQQGPQPSQSRPQPQQNRPRQQQSDQQPQQGSDDFYDDDIPF